MSALAILGYPYLLIGALVALIGLLNSSRPASGPVMLVAIAMTILFWPLGFLPRGRNS